MKHYLSLSKVVFVLVIIVAIIGLTAFAQEKPASDSFRKEKSASSAGTSRYPGNNYRNIEESMKMLDIEMEKLNVQMKKMDFSKMESDINAAMKEVNAAKIEKQVKEALDKVDWKKINEEIELAMNEVDKAELADVKKSLEKTEKQLQIEMKDFKIRIPEIDGAKLRGDVEKAMKKAEKDLKSAKAELKNLDDFTTALQNDGVINKKDIKKIEFKDGLLYINGKQQSKEITDKYRKYFKKEKFTIRMNSNDDDWI